MDKIALGFSNTVDYEISWNAAHLENLIRRTGLLECEIEEKRRIRSMKDLLASILFHMREGSGCGFITEVPDVIDEFIKGTEYRVSLGGSNLRAARVISDLGGSALVHLVSVNEETIREMPAGISWIGGGEFACCFPHIALQFPRNARVCANDIDITAPRANRVIYSGDIACAKMPLDREFFARASASTALLLTGFDMIADVETLKKRLEEVCAELAVFSERRPMIFYEHACFLEDKYEDMVLCALKPYIDVYSMNEDEFQMFAGKKIDMLNKAEVQGTLALVHARIPDATIIVHTSHWVLASGPRSAGLAQALEIGMLAASTRYRIGSVDHKEIAVTKGLPVQKASKDFAEEMEAASGHCLKCLPAPDVSVDAPVTVGLGDSFVGGFLYEYCFDKSKEED